MKAQGVNLSGNMLVMEGCVSDDSIILGGKFEFMSHFCTFFNFSACMTGVEGMALKGTSKLLADPDAFDKKLNEFVNSVDS